MTLDNADFGLPAKQRRLFGYCVSGAGTNGDGLDDLLIGAYENDDGGTGAGKTYLLFSDM